MITSIYNGFASVNFDFYVTVHFSFFLNFYLVSILWKKCSSRCWTNAKNFITVSLYTNTHNSYTIWLSSYLFVSLAARLSLIPSHSHALQQLIRFINSYHCFIVRINYVSLSWSFAPIRLPTFRFSSAIPHIRLLVQKLRQSLFPFTPFSFLLFFFLLLIFGDHNATREGALIDETFLHVVSHARI